MHVLRLNDMSETCSDSILQAQEHFCDSYKDQLRGEEVAQNLRETCTTMLVQTISSNSPGTPDLFTDRITVVNDENGFCVGVIQESM